ncbi:hypothetical protein Golomagni_06659 [Golovinomyces magnicellulatus]|nr:hypothetical protein Golomagni_06659 [Golovinomyces magnicellulatus]
MSFLHEHDHGDGHGHSHSHSHSHEHTHDLDKVSSSGSSTNVEIEEREYPVSHGHHAHKHNISKAAHPGRDLGMLGVLIHVIGDAINNVGVIISALVIWKTEGENRYYVDPAVGVFIAIMIFVTAIPLTKHSGGILLQIAPGGINMDDVKHDIEMIPGIESVHELHVWRLNQRKSVASAHIVVTEGTVASFTEKAKVIMECLHAYGIHSATLQPEVMPEYPGGKESIHVSSKELRHRKTQTPQCQLICSSLCHGMRCCPPVQIS